MSITVPAKGLRRIALFNVNWLGDVLFSTAVIRNLHMNFPQSSISCIVPARCFPVLEGNPHLKEVIAFDEKGAQRGLFAKAAFISALATRKFDAVFLLHRSFSRGLLCYLSGIPVRVGYAYAKRNFLLTGVVPAPDLFKVHRIDYYLGVLEGAGLRITDRYPEIFMSPAEESSASDFLRVSGVRNGEILVGVNPGGNWLPKRWPLGHWKSLVGELSLNPKYRVIITGGLADIPLATEIAAAARGKLKPLIACGQSGLRQFAALSKQMDLFISADSGPLHIANAAGAKRIVALFGPTHPVLTGPRPADRVDIIRVDCGCHIPCYQADCADNRCMKMISPEVVLSRVLAILRDKLC